MIIDILYLVNTWKQTANLTVLLKEEKIFLFCILVVFVFDIIICVWYLETNILNFGNNTRHSHHRLKGKEILLRVQLFWWFLYFVFLYLITDILYLIIWTNKCKWFQSLAKKGKFSSHLKSNSKLILSLSWRFSKHTINWWQLSMKAFEC